VSLHADALRTLDTWTAPDAVQEALRTRFVTHLRAHGDGVERSCFPDHLTAGVLVVDSAGEHVLLNLHRKARRWFHFGGHLEPGDATLLGAARREGLEESGLPDLAVDPVPAQLSEHTVGFCDLRGAVQHLDVRYVARAPLAAQPEVSEESLDVRWWPVSDLPELEDEMHELIAVARSRFAAR
jgi:8-oxo-dGTP pyrophosphatase MutT (NUDIX family)